MTYFSAYDSYAIKERFNSYSNSYAMRTSFSSYNKDYSGYSDYSDYFKSCSYSLSNYSSIINNRGRLFGSFSYSFPSDDVYPVSRGFYSNSLSGLGDLYKPKSLYDASWSNNVGKGYVFSSWSNNSGRYGFRSNSLNNVSSGVSPYASSSVSSYSGYTPLTTGSFARTYSDFNEDCKSREIRYSYKAVDGDVQAKLGPEFLAKVKEVANNINCDYKDLLAVMNAESGLNPAKQNNAGHQMYGLIQFSTDSAHMVGSTHSKLVKMSAVEQMDYVEKYYKHWIKEKGWQGRKLSAADLYALTLAPGRAQNNVLYTKAANRKQYFANIGIDTNFGNNDGKIDKNDCNNFIASFSVDESIFA